MYLRFVDNSENLKTRNGSSIFSSLSLGIVEVSWDSDYGMSDGGTKIIFSNFLHFAEDHGTDFFSGKSLQDRIYHKSLG